ncbi:RNA pol II accessory factor, Cdc73 family-domain-containing protein [Polychytrium aggregatum]|uniref:RNA pol II accessory factor, Cdc73 family-domain-containing protein n=1 Tax=Polychytrium aggregatum TaxID=110093 RepID=UPI0022FDD720|nr:RNA pol II accessory factor, Cdc73 family-domain-containing protein [Polychytrium aggregatum]KAI9202863.1 RNA pol II accessory factor, Cdc73 family-domain-containing protein [Polychytrium aggregatum]
MAEAVALLRKYTVDQTQYVLLRTEDPGSQVSDIDQAAYLLFPAENKVFRLQQPSSYREYSLQTILYFLQYRKLDHSAYLQACGDRDIETVSFIHRKELEGYLIGTLDASAINLNIPDSVLGKRPAEDNVDAAKRGRLDVAPAEGLNSIKWITDHERTVYNRASILSIKSTRNFLGLQKLAAEIFGKRTKQPPPQHPPTAAAKNGPPRDPARPAAQSRLPQKPQPPTTTHPISNTSDKPRADPRSSSSSVSKPTSSRQDNKAKGTPIIVVPAIATSLITLYNAPQFLRDSVFQPSEEIRQAAKQKPLPVTIERPNTATRTGPKSFQITDSPERLTAEEWDNVVAVFATGQAWQFSRWKYNQPVDLFSKVKGFALKYADDPKNPCANWNVEVLNIHKSRRHLDAQSVYDFWSHLDEWIATHKRNQFA